MVGWLFSTTTLVSVMLPLLLMLPVKVSTPPGATALVGQTLVRTSAGCEICRVAQLVTLLQLPLTTTQ